jgi:hypothetical protein
MDGKFSMLDFFKKSIFVTRIFGLTIFKYPNDGFKFCLMGCFFSIFNISLNLVKLYGAVLYMQQGESSNLSINVKTVYTLLNLTFIASLICTSLIMVINVILSKKVFKVLKLIEILDFEVRKKQ